MNINLLILSVVSIWSVAVITPGPNLFITLQTSVKGSRLAGLFVVLGTCTGTIIWSIAGYFGIAYLFNTFPWIYTILKVIGGSYIIYLGVISIISSRKYSAKSHIPEESSQYKYKGYWKGLITNLSNPKTAMFITSLFASVLPKAPTIYYGIMISALMATISFVWYSFVVLIFSSNKFRNAYNKMQSWVEGFAGIIFIIFGVRLVFGNK
jgi:RhtB (resistance to homoserine/threonine) family protein